MTTTISINSTTCIKCGHCVRICPVHIFFQETPRGEVQLQNISSCIRCGHCVGVCPTSSVIHSEFPPEKIHRIDRELLPTPEQVMLLCKTRRSNRALKSQPVPETMLNQILEAAHAAPTGSNVQQVSFTLVTDPEKVRKVVDLSMTVFSGILNVLQSQPESPAISRMIGYITHLTQAYSQGVDPILRGAETLLLFHTPKELSFGYADANLAYQNGSLMAEALGVSQFYTGFLCTAIKEDKTESITNYLGIDGVVHAGMALGMPEFKFVNYVDRDEMKVTRF